MACPYFTAIDSPLENLSVHLFGFGIGKITRQKKLNIILVLDNWQNNLIRHLYLNSNYFVCAPPTLSNSIAAYKSVSLTQNI